MAKFMFQPTMIDYRGLYKKLDVRPASSHTVPQWPSVGFALHKSDSGWAISEVSTGCAIQFRSTQAEAIEAVQKIADNMPEAKLLEHLDSYRAKIAAAIPFDSELGRIHLAETEARKAKERAESDLRWAIRSGYIYPEKPLSAKLENYLISVTPLRAGKIRAALAKLTRQNGVVGTRCFHAEAMAAKGAQVVGDFVYTDRAEGRGFMVKDITKAAADYIAWLTQEVVA